MFDEEHVKYRYKYLRCSEGSLSILTDSTIKFTCPSEFNDPFDCFPYYDTTNIEELARRRHDLIRAIGEDMGLSPSERIQHKHKIIARLRRYVEDGSYSRDVVRSVGVVSLSRNALSIPMWSHYADFHRGLVLEFRIPTQVEGTPQEMWRFALDHLFPLDVKYEPDRPHIGFGSPPQEDDVDKLLRIKSLNWKYEEEERVIDHVRGPGIHKYRRDDVLCSMIAGLKTSDDHYTHLESLVKGLRQSSVPNLMLYRARAKNDEYKLEVHGHPRLAVAKDNVD